MRGDIHRLKRPRAPVGHEQQGPRFAIVVQSDDLYVSTLIVVPTSRSARPMAHRPGVTIEGEITRAMPEQVMAIDPGRLGEQVGRLALDEMQLVDDALRVVMTLD